MHIFIWMLENGKYNLCAVLNQPCNENNPISESSRRLLRMCCGSCKHGRWAVEPNDCVLPAPCADIEPAVVQLMHEANARPSTGSRTNYYPYISKIAISLVKATRLIQKFAANNIIIHTLSSIPTSKYVQGI